MIKLTTQQKTAIRKDWADTLAQVMLCDDFDGKFNELRGQERADWDARNPVFLEKFRYDVKEFLNTVIDFRQEQARILLESDDECFDYIKRDFVSFAQYGGTECRLIYRTFFALRGYESFSYWLETDCLDKQAIEFIRKIFSTIALKKFKTEMQKV